MPSRPIVLVDESRPITVEAVVDAQAIRLPPEAVERALGWTLKPEGLCRGAECVPIREAGALVRDDGLDLGALARLLDRPLAMEPSAGIAVLGGSAAARGHRLASMEAPDFTLP